MENPASQDRSVSFSRRSFGRRVVTAAAASVFPTVVVAEPRIGSTSVQHLGPKPEGLSDADWDEVYARYSNLLRMYGKRLSIEEKHRLVVILTTNQQMLASIRSFHIENSDPSACTLRLQT